MKTLHPIIVHFMLVLAFLFSNALLAQGSRYSAVEQDLGFTIGDFKPRGFLEGAIVVTVLDGLPADGVLKPEDVIVKIDDMPIRMASGAIAYMDAVLGKKNDLSLTIYRNGVEVIVPWKLPTFVTSAQEHSSSAPSRELIPRWRLPASSSMEPEYSPSHPSRMVLGIAIRDYFQDGELQGVLVTNVIRGGPAEGVLIPDDIIKRIDGNFVSSTQELIKFLQQVPRHYTSVSLDIIRNEERKQIFPRLATSVPANQEVVPNPCLIRVAKDRNGNLLYVAPTSYLVRIKETDPSPHVMQDHLVRDAMKMNDEGPFRTLAPRKWCESESPDIVIPVKLILHRDWTGITEGLEAVLGRASQGFEQDVTYVVHNNAGIRGKIVSCLVQEQSQGDSRVKNRGWLKELALSPGGTRGRGDLTPDRFLTVEEYEMLEISDRAYREALARKALNRLSAQAQFVGVEEHDITRAILEGRFNPHLEDLLLAYEGLQIVSGIAPASLSGLKSCDTPENYSYESKRAWEDRFGEMPEEAIRYLESTYPNQTTSLNRNFTPIEYFEAYTLNLRPNSAHALYQTILRSEKYLPLWRKIENARNQAILEQQQHVAASLAKKPESTSETRSSVQPQTDSSIRQTARATEEPNVLSALIVAFFNAAFLEFGDELWCAVFSPNFDRCHDDARELIMSMDHHHPWVTIVGAVAAGYLLYPFAMIYQSRYRVPINTWEDAFRVYGKMEAIEGGIMALGEAFTYGDAGLLFLSLLIGAIIALLRATMMAWKIDAVFRAQVNTFIVISLATILYYLSNR